MIPEFPEFGGPSPANSSDAACVRAYVRACMQTCKRKFEESRRRLGRYMASPASNTGAHRPSHDRCGRICTQVPGTIFSWQLSPAGSPTRSRSTKGQERAGFGGRVAPSAHRASLLGRACVLFCGTALLYWCLPALLQNWRRMVRRPVVRSNSSGKLVLPRCLTRSAHVLLLRCS